MTRATFLSANSKFLHLTLVKSGVKNGNNVHSLCHKGTPVKYGERVENVRAQTVLVLLRVVADRVVAPVGEVTGEYFLVTILLRSR